MLIQKVVRPDSIIARALHLVEFCNTIGGRADITRRERRFRF
jgi:hypothetical protein